MEEMREKWERCVVVVSHWNGRKGSSCSHPLFREQLNLKESLLIGDDVPWLSGTLDPEGAVWFFLIGSFC